MLFFYENCDVSLCGSYISRDTNEMCMETREKSGPVICDNPPLNEQINK